MFDFLGSEDVLSDEDKEYMKILTAKRITHGEANLKYQRLYLRYLQDPSESNKADLDLFADMTYNPGMIEVQDTVKIGIKRAVDIEALKSMVPMMALLAKNAINIPLLLGVININPALVDEVMEMVTDFVQKDTL